MIEWSRWLNQSWLDSTSLVKLRVSPAGVLGGRKRDRKGQHVRGPIEVVFIHLCLCSHWSLWALDFLYQGWDISLYFPFCCLARKGRVFRFSFSPNVIHEASVLWGTCGCVLNAICRKTVLGKLLPQNRETSPERVISGAQIQQAQPHLAAAQT